MIRDGLEAGSVADVVNFPDQGGAESDATESDAAESDATKSEATRQRWMVDWAGLTGGALMGVGIVLGLVYLFLGVQRPWRDGTDRLNFLLANALGTGVLVASAVLVVAGSWPTAAPEWPDSRSRRRVCGGLLAAGPCALSLVGSLATLGGEMAGLEHVADLPLGVTWWLPVATGSGLALIRKGGLASVGRPGRPGRADALPLALLAITVAGALANSLPAWVQYTFTGSMGPHSEDLTIWYTAPWIEFGAPWVEIAGSVAPMVVIVAMAAAAALWRPPRLGAVFLTGAVLALVSEAMIGINDVIKAPPRSYFGIPAAARMTVSVAGTPWLWAFCGFTAALIAVYGWLFIRSRPRPRPVVDAVTWMVSAAPWAADEPLL